MVIYLDKAILHDILLLYQTIVSSIKILKVDKNDHDYIHNYIKQRKYWSTFLLIGILNRKLFILCFQIMLN